MSENMVERVEKVLGHYVHADDRAMEAAARAAIEAMRRPTEEMAPNIILCVPIESGATMSSAGSFAPGGLWGLLEMLKSYAADYVRLTRMLEEISNELALLPSFNTPLESNAPIMVRLDRLSKAMQASSTTLSLPITRDQVARLDAALDDRDDKEIVMIFKQLRHIIESELATHSFLHIKPELVPFFGDRFTNEVEEKFPKTISDTENAGKCLAVGQGTACVFHLMRAMESTIQTLSDKLEIPNVEREWGKLLSDISRKIEGMEKGNVRNRWSESHAHLYHVKQAWRNDTMHPNEKYTDDEALEVYRAVKTFMAHLATLI